MEYIKSDDFFGGFYADKVIEVHSAQRGAEKDENIRQLLEVEDPNNPIEIVVHVNMLKEGWDVTNLYTIIPLRASTSVTLTEQTIGRGLRLPYGKITGNEAVDRLTIVAHDKFDDIIRAANDENSIIKKENIIEIEDSDTEERVPVKPKGAFEQEIAVLQRQHGFARSDDKKRAIESQIKSKQFVGKALDELTSQVINVRIPLGSVRSEELGVSSEGLNNNLSDTSNSSLLTSNWHKTISLVPSKQDFVRPEMKEILVERAMDVARREREVGGQIVIISDEEVADIKRNIETVLEPTVSEIIKSTIDIPNIAMVAVGDAERIIRDFDLNTQYIFEYKTPTDEVIMENLKTGDVTTATIESGVIALDDNPVPYILGEVLNQNPFVPYDKYSDLLVKLVNQMLEHVGKGKTPQQLSKTLAAYKKEIAREISKQLNDNSDIIPPKHELKLMQKSMPIRTEIGTTIKSGGIKKITEKVPAYMIKKVAFGGLSKACVEPVKFDSVPEHDFAVVLERTVEVIKWLRPAMGQIPLSTSGGVGYQPDFIVETTDSIYIIEIKAKNDLYDDAVQIKAKSAMKYCENVNSIFAVLPTCLPTGKTAGKVGEVKTGDAAPNTHLSAGKQWKFALIADYHISRASDFMDMLARAERW